MKKAKLKGAKKLVNIGQLGSKRLSKSEAKEIKGSNVTGNTYYVGSANGGIWKTTNPSNS